MNIINQTSFNHIIIYNSKQIYLKLIKCSEPDWQIILFEKYRWMNLS